MSFLVFVTICTIVSAYTYENRNIEYFVSKTATNVNVAGCGSQNQPCPTLFDASTEIDITINGSWWLYWLGDIVIHVIDGQNEEVLTTRKQQNPQYNPCLPLPLNHTGHLSIKFDASIYDSNQWFPQHICSGNYSNSYMFYSEKTLTLYNLIINNYTTNVAIAYTYHEESSITCDNCYLSNIISTHNNALFQSNVNMHILDSKFENIESNGNIIYIGSSKYGRTVLFERTQFLNINTSQCIIDVSTVHGSKAVDNHIGEIIITDAIFNNIYTDFYIIWDQAAETDVSISNTEIHLSNNGYIYFSVHSYVSYITLNNISISRKVDHTPIPVTNNEYPQLFWFRVPDLITINNMSILYSIDSKLCNTLEHVTNSINGASCLSVRCESLPTLFRNDGQITMDHIQVDAVVENVITNYSCIKYEYIPDSARYPFIENRNELEINDMVITRSIAYVFIYNLGILSVSNIHFIWDKDVLFNPNELQSHSLIVQIISTTSMYISDSYFLGADQQIYVVGGSVQVLNCIFEGGNNALNFYMVNYVLFQDSIVRNSGDLYGRFREVDSGWHWNPAVVIEVVDDITVSNNTFCGYNADALLYIRFSIYSLVVNNTFNVYDDELFYNVSSANIGFYWGYVSTIRDSTYAEVIGNTFLQNKVDPGAAWFELEHVDSVCVAGNSFTNFGLYVNDSIVTSCFRPGLIECVDAYNHSNCTYGLYGDMDTSLFNLFSTYVLDDLSKDGTVIAADGSIVALDNVNIISNSSMSSQHPVINVTEGQLLLVDAYVTSSVLSYNVDVCNMIYKEHLHSNVKYISRLLMNCNTVQSESVQSQSEIKLVNHLSATNANITARIALYYPGDLLTFEYHLTDRYNNLIEYDGINTTVYLVHDVFLGTLFIEKSKCRNCESGLLLSDVLLNNIGDKYEMDIMMEDIFFSTHSTISVRIIGCPAGFCPDNNEYHCQKCNTDYYSILPNNSKQCIPCDPLLNPGVKCSSGTIDLAYNYWMGLDGDNIISGICPSGRCCTKHNGCNYIVDSKYILCAENRDPNSILCGKCKKGFSESITSTNCVKCKRSFYIEYVLIPLGLSLFIAIVLLRIDRSHSMLKIMILNCVIYYEQSISEILSSTTISPLFNLFSSLFNLSIITNTNIVGDVCFIHGLTAKAKILMGLFIPITLPIIIALLYVIHKSIFEKRIAIAQTFVTMFLLIVGKILDVLFKLLCCVRLSDHPHGSVHFYFGDEHCFGATWVTSIVILIMIFVIFASTFIRLKRMTPIQRTRDIDRDHIFYALTSRYTRKYYYWEFLVFIRRVIITAFGVMVQDMNWRLLFVAVMIFYAYLQQRYNPFVSQEINNMEFILLWCLIFVILSQFPYTLQLNQIVISVGIAWLTICPIVLLIYYLFKGVTDSVDKIEVPDDEEDYDIYIGDPKLSINSIEMRKKRAEM